MHFPVIWAVLQLELVGLDINIYNKDQLKIQFWNGMKYLCIILTIWEIAAAEEWLFKLFPPVKKISSTFTELLKLLIVKIILIV